jgi:hypothetical protein
MSVMVSIHDGGAEASDSAQRARNEPGVQWLNRIVSRNAVETVDDDAENRRRLLWSRANARRCAAINMASVNGFCCLN